MSKRAILVVSFGTTQDDARQKNIASLEEEIARAYPEYEVRRAFTSGVVVRRLQARGLMVDTVEAALGRLREDAFEEVVLQPTHIIPGFEYEKLLSQAKAFSAAFRVLRVGKPLLYTAQDFARVADALLSAYPVQKDEALLLMGHGTSHFANCAYPAMDYVLRSGGGKHAFVATVEGYPDFESVLARMQAKGYRQAALAPMMLVAGEHAKNDMSGDEPDSWKNICIRHGVQPRCILSGLGELPKIRRLYIEHARDCIDAESVL